MQKSIDRTDIEGLLIIKSPFFEDSRGYFKEILQLRELSEAGVDFEFKQWNFSHSLPKVLRGFHAEPWNKIIFTEGSKVFGAYADIRPESRTFGKVETIQFEATNNIAVFVPKGVTNSFCVIGDTPANYVYLNDDYYQGPNKRAVIWNDPDLNVNWPISDPIISEADLENPTLRELVPEKF